MYWLLIFTLLISSACSAMELEKRKETNDTGEVRFVLPAMLKTKLSVLRKWEEGKKIEEPKKSERYHKFWSLTRKPL